MVKIVFENVSASLKFISLVLIAINMYVLMFSNIPFLYRLGITIYIFVLLVLFSVALGSISQLEKSRPN